MRTPLHACSVVVGATVATTLFLSMAATNDPGSARGDEMVWTLDQNGHPSSRVTLREGENDEWKPVLWTTYHPNGKKRSQGMNQNGEKVAGSWSYWDAEGKAVDRTAQIANLRKAITELMAKPEHEATNIEVQHILIAFKGAPRIQGITRSKSEAEELAAELFAQLKAGADMLELVKAHTDDSPPGIYPMSAANRRGMVAGFGDVGWRLKVGEVGVSPHDQQKSPYGWHIIKRLK